MNIDPLTKQEFVPRHLNQRFESRKNQIKYNNLKARRKRAAKKKYDQPLDRNRNILIKILNGSNEAIKSKDWLLALGYNFNIFFISIDFIKWYFPFLHNESFFIKFV